MSRQYRESIGKLEPTGRVYMRPRDALKRILKEFDRFAENDTDERRLSALKEIHRLTQLGLTEKEER